MTKILTGRVFESVDIVQVVVVELVQQWIERLLDLVEINDPTRLGVYGALNGDTDPIGVTVQTLALVALGDLGQPMSRLKAKICVQLHNGIPYRVSKNRGDSTRFDVFCDA